MASETLTTTEAAAEAAAECGSPVYRYQIVRLFEYHDLPEPPRHCGKRIILRCMLPQIVDALRARGWVPAASPSETEALAP